MQGPDAERDQGQSETSGKQKNGHWMRLKTPAFSTILLCMTLLIGQSAEAQSKAPKFAPAKQVIMEHMILTLTPDLQKRSATATVDWHFTVKQEVRRLSLNAVKLAVNECLNVKTKQKLKYANTGTQLIVNFGRTLKATEKYQLRISYSIDQPDQGMYFRGPSLEDPNVPWQLWTQGEASETRHWIPCLDQPDQRHSTEVLVTAETSYEVLSNGLLLEKKVLNKNKGAVWHWKQEKSHPVYLVSIVVGKFDVVREQHNDLELSYYVPLGHKQQIPNSFANTAKMMDYFSQLTGQDYPWDKYAQVVVSQFTFGGMENTSATTLNESTLHSKRAHLDFRSDGLVAHELAHQWFGDLVTCHDWANIWLNEGFATYFEALWAEKDRGYAEFQWNMYQKSRAAIGGGQKAPIVDRFFNTPMDLFDARAYPKGAWVLHQLRNKIGEENFWKGIQHYVKNWKFNAPESSDLRRSLEKASGHSLGLFFHEKLHRAGHAKYKMTMTWNENEQLLQIDMAQTQKAEIFAEPIEIRVKVGDKSHSRHISMVNFVGKKNTRIYWPLAERPSAVQVDPDEKMLKELTIKKPNDWWVAQLNHCRNPVGRYRAVVELGKQRRSKQCHRALLQALKTEKFWAVRSEILAQLKTRKDKASRQALIAALRDPHPNVRRASLNHLEPGPSSDALKTALNKLWKAGDPSIKVEAALVTCLAKHDKGKALAVIQRAIKTNSHRDQIRYAGMRALQKFSKPEHFALWLKLTQPGVNYYTKRFAMSELARLGQKKISKSQFDTLLNRIKSLLNDTAPRMRRLGLETLRKLGAKGQLHRKIVDMIANYDSDDGLRKLAAETLKSLRKKSKSNPELEKLKKRLQALEKQSKEMKKDMDKLRQVCCKGRQSH